MANSKQDYSLNDEKTEFMLIGSRSRLVSVDNRAVLKLGHKHATHIHNKLNVAWYGS